MKKVIFTIVAALGCISYASAFKPFESISANEASTSILLAETNSIPSTYHGTYYAEDPRYSVSVYSNRVDVKSMAEWTTYRVYGYSSRDKHATLQERIGGTLAPQYSNTLTSLSFVDSRTIYLDGQKYTKR